MKLLTLLLGLTVLILIGACGKAVNTNKSISTNSTNASASPKSNDTKSSGTTVATRVATPEAASNGLLDAWKTKDKTAAATYATEAAYEKLFTEGGGPEGMQSQGCNDNDGTYDCAYTYEGGALIMYVKGSESAGYKVQSIEFIAD